MSHQHQFKYININNLYKGFADDEELLIESLKVLLSTYDRMLDNITNAIHSKNLNAIKVSSHTFKGAISNFFIDAGIDAAFTIEQKSLEGDLEAAIKSYDSFIKIAQQIKLELEIFYRAKAAA